jgi:hypothetical protein
VQEMLQVMSIALAHTSTAIMIHAFIMVISERQSDSAWLKVS